VLTTQNHRIITLSSIIRTLIKCHVVVASTHQLNTDLFFTILTTFSPLNFCVHERMPSH